MKKTIITVFLILAVLVLVFLVWELFFADTGILHTAYNGIAGGINDQFRQATGDSSTLIPMWDNQNSQNSQHNMKAKDEDGGFGIEIEGAKKTGS